MKNKQKRIGWIVVILAVVLFLLPEYLAPVCRAHGETMMHCRHMATANQGVAVLLAVMGVMIVLCSHVQIARGIAVGGILVSCLAVANSAFLLGGCNSPVMSCNVMNIPMTYAVCALTAMALAYFVFTEGKEK